jgi:hypothetical protein
MHFEYIFRTDSGRVVVPAKTEDEAKAIVRTSGRYRKAAFVGKQLIKTKTEFV